MRSVKNAIRKGSWLVCDWQFLRGGLYCVEVDCPRIGFFAQLGGLMPLLRYCHHRNLKPYIVLSAGTYTESSLGPGFLDYFFQGPAYTEQQSELIRNLPIRKVDSFLDIPNWSRNSYPSLKESRAFFEQYYRLKLDVATEADAFARAYFKPGATLGVHYRGTDKSNEASPASFEYSLTCIMQCLRLHPEVEVIFVATDTASYVDFIRNALSAFRIVVREGEMRSLNDKPAHLSGMGTPYQRGRDALMNCLILSRCDVLLKTMSNLSGWAKVFNPLLKVYIINRPAKAGIEWLGFPEREMIEKQWFVPAMATRTL